MRIHYRRLAIGIALVAIAITSVQADGVESPKAIAERFMTIDLRENMDELKALVADDLVYVDATLNNPMSFSGDVWLAGVQTDWESADVLEIDPVRIREESMSSQRAVISIFYEATVEDAFGIMPPVNKAYRLTMENQDGHWKIVRIARLG